MRMMTDCPPDRARPPAPLDKARLANGGSVTFPRPGSAPAGRLARWLLWTAACFIAGLLVGLTA